MGDDRRLRVLWLIKGLGPGGAEHLLASAAEVHDQTAFEIEVAYLLPWKSALVPRLEEAGVKTRCLGVRGPLDPRWALRLRRLLKSRRYDVVHVHSPIVASFSRLLVRALGKGRPRIITTEHNVWRSYSRPTRTVNALTYPLNDRILAVSDDVRDSVAPRLRGRVEVVVHGIILDKVREARASRDQVRAELGVGPDEVLIGTVANFRADKAYPDLIEAARIVVGRHPEARFVAIGQGPLQEQIEERHREANLGERFRLLGYRPDAVRIVGGWDLFVLASVNEGFPVAIMEALAVGVPVVSTAVGGVPGAVRNGVDGLLVPRSEPRLLADAISQVVADDDLRGRMAAAAYERGGVYDIRTATGRIEAVYREMVGQAPEAAASERSLTA